MPEIPTKFSAFPVNNTGDQILVAGRTGYRIRVIEWFFNYAGNTSTNDISLYFGPNRTEGRVIAAGHILQAKPGWSPRSQVSVGNVLQAGLAEWTNKINYQKWTSLEGESLGLYLRSSSSIWTVAFVTYEWMRI